MTGFGQVQRFMSEQIASELGTEYFEVSAHGGARPEHAEWQGGIYTKDELETICGLGDPLGLCGINCYHSYDPFIPGVSVRRYSDEDLERLRQEDAEEHEWNGKSYNKYEALQEQRHMERQMRKYRRDAELLEQGGADDELIENKRIKYQTKFSQYKAFSKTMGLPMQRDRIYNDGLSVRKASYTFLGSSHSRIVGGGPPQLIGKINPKKVDEAVHYFEEKIRDKPIEYAYIFQPDGSLYASKGNSNSVNVSGVDLKGAIVTHNHPESQGIVSFGKDDFLFLRDHQDISLFKVVNVKYTYSVKVVKKIDNVSWSELYCSIDKPVSSASDIDIQHEAFEILRRKGYVKYERVKFN